MSTILAFISLKLSCVAVFATVDGLCVAQLFAVLVLLDFAVSCLLYRNRLTC